MGPSDGQRLNIFGLLLIVAILFNLPALWLPIIEPDGALYATIAKKMVRDGDWLNMYGNGSDWLDKPHFPFWVTALSYSVFGINSFAYKLPAFLFWLLGLRFTYLTGNLLYNRRVAEVAVLIQATALHTVLANFDVRAEPYLTTTIIGAVYYMLLLDRDSSGKALVMAAFFTAAALMTKGLFVLITIGAGWGIYWLVTAQWKFLVDWRWWAWLALSFIFILPELYALYVQFDMHPEKLVFGKYEVSGIRFFFWDSQFGRFFNTGPIKGSGDPTFFVHTTLWAFLPWTLGLLAALFYKLRPSLKDEPRRWVLLGSVAVTFLLFSLSKFQLPHYIIICFPYMAIITANGLVQLDLHARLRGLIISQNIIFGLVVGLVLALSYWVGLPHWPWLIVGALLAIGAVLVGKRANGLEAIMVKGMVTFCLISGFLFFIFYPFLFKYQSGSEVAKQIKDDWAGLPIGTYDSFSYAFEFYAPGEVQLLDQQADLAAFLETKPALLYTSKAIADSLTAAGLKTQLITDSEHFHITRLKGKFLNPKTRTSTLEARRLLLIE
ncbi:4-amino-4-deoxy-L-arabinose transferase-like glycosyltransferase [Dyadobacter jejuensis]|uniref:4-amino-4-deoxy-L-arabinose transferase-like glycosyltransferase n=1 Tax=Dyadobacter jejuensis TaxID=1082580 RepID=A0A316AUS7_9BACT|nr:glycosyltransferase family 39 protein [Dyadobacter jejuensis]PWJ60450.1 4-amino-4-deoxy-L-arabinose transferase-like glycosyltransferase [Dyadobacter jejuensis]